MLPFFGWGQLGSKRGDPWYRRPTRYVRRQTIVGSSPFIYFHCCLLTTKSPQDMYFPPSPHKKRCPPTTTTPTPAPSPHGTCHTTPHIRSHEVEAPNMTATHSTMSPSNNARTDANDAHQRTNDQRWQQWWTMLGLHHPLDLSNLAALHGDVS